MSAAEIEDIAAGWLLRREEGGWIADGAAAAAEERAFDEHPAVTHTHPGCRLGVVVSEINREIDRLDRLLQALREPQQHQIQTGPCGQHFHLEPLVL